MKCLKIEKRQREQNGREKEQRVRKSINVEAENSNQVELSIVRKKNIYQGQKNYFERRLKTSFRERDRERKKDREREKKAKKQKERDREAGRKEEKQRHLKRQKGGERDRLKEKERIIDERIIMYWKCIACNFFSPSLPIVAEIK